MTSEMSVDHPKEGAIGQGDEARHGISDGFSFEPLVLMRSDSYYRIFGQYGYSESSHCSIAETPFVMMGGAFLLPTLVIELAGHVKVGRKVVRLPASAGRSAPYGGRERVIFEPRRRGDGRRLIVAVVG
eukprot:CAMPEP_0172576242 /NCGR_PEP_ID=MMETSP1067-20121228/137624_1 /TAXON_ID=265564 ORGANISM="Thalassiosira punctigera, Strain Tpunct2005C2" /NCGR_SAMPLE_ID=MMETSP1067 /ASSEMBLY_ACC=CAM_ASM_000444 /LENGTH=128 /DNA_ID=CAMNT_0013368905 /DNA_START=866 /DNA_END=1252 /DNA_ORIENTATION=-